MLSPGTRLGPYEITAPLGAGGMGEVYRARDTRLGRDVALKVLPEHLSANAEIRARFEREAKTVSSLNHPHICTLYDVGRQGDTDFLVLELVEGETLAQRLSRGPLPLPDVLRLGAQVADALDRAHKAGVVHRDLKPGNVMLTRQGAKLMDFGLARATGLAPLHADTMAHSPTIAGPLTAEGSLVGTFQYMAPEQLEGQDADARSDIWALGCVLYEMIAGRRAFEGKSQASLISAIMGQAPAPLSQVAPVAPPALERVIATSLEKDPEERWQSAGDLRRELQWIAGDSSHATGVGSASSVAQAAGVAAEASREAARARTRAALRANAGWIVAGALALVAGLAAFGPWSGRGAGPRALMRFEVAAPPGTQLPSPCEPAFSPEGRAFVFDAADSSGTIHLWVRRLDDAAARMVPGTERAGLPFWSPDGKTLAFFSDGKLRRVTLDGTLPTVLCDAPDPRGGAWSADGTILFAPSNAGGIWRVAAAGGDPVEVTRVDTARGERGHRYPQWLPDGRHFLYVALGKSEETVTWAASAAGGKPVEVMHAGTMGRFAPPGWLLYLDATESNTEHRLFARHFDAGSLKVSGGPVLVAEHVTTNNFGYANLATTPDGNLVIQRSAPRHAAFEWWDAQGRPIGTAVADLDGAGATVSPDRTRIAYTGFDPQDLFVRDLATGIATRLTFEKRSVINFVWSPDGRRIAFSRLVTGQGWEIHVKNADGSGPDSLLFRGPGLFSYPSAWSQDGRWLLAQCTDATGNYDLWKIPMDGSAPPSPWQKTPGTEVIGFFSPDGKWVSYVVTEGDKNYAYVQSFPDPGTKYQLPVADPAVALWLSTGDAIFVPTITSHVWRVPVTVDGGVRFGVAQPLFTMRGDAFVSDLLRDGSRLLVGRPLPIEQPDRLEVVLGWPQLIAAR